MTLDIERLEPTASGPRFDGTYELLQQLAAEADPDMDRDTIESFRNKLIGNETFEKVTLVGSDGDEVVGLARVWFFNIEGNRDLAEARIEVHPDRRRAGFGTEMLRAAVDLCAANDRPKLLGHGLNAGANAAFWESFELECGLVERKSRVWVDQVDQQLMQQWIDQRQERAADYRLEFWTGPTPSHLLEPLAVLSTAMNDAPVDDLDVGDDVWTTEDVVELDEFLAGAGLERWTTIAFGPDDEPAGLTVVTRNTAKPRIGGQGDTVVIDAHRGRGIGRWLKADMIERVRADAPDVQALDTENAGSNDAMLAINIAMGFAPVYELGYWQSTVADLRPKLG